LRLSGFSFFGFQNTLQPVVQKQNTAGLGYEYLHFCKLTFLLRIALIKEMINFFCFFFLILYTL